MGTFFITRYISILKKPFVLNFYSLSFMHACIKEKPRVKESLSANFFNNDRKSNKHIYMNMVFARSVTVSNKINNFLSLLLYNNIRNK